ncbi:MAG TPA: DUF4118 domain-containing protein, partial [Acidobacteriaceae bacterium]|nr:DUF4118 domain-containing protein [Acidobacteriaceae bacterium]
MNSPRTVAVTRWVISVGALAGIVLVFRSWVHVNPTTVALALLLLILLLASEWGLRYAIAVSLLATACYNFFFLPPVGTFTVADPQNWLALFAFLATSVIASRLSHRARNRAEEAQSRQRELEVLFRLSRELLRTDNVSDLLHTVPSTVASVVGARGSALYLLEGDRLFQAGYQHTKSVERPHFRQLSETLASVRVESDEIQIPMRTGVRPRGLILLSGATLSMQTAEAIGDLVSVAIDRVQALEQLAKGEAAKESERLRNLIIDSITHELRTPLTSIKGSASTLLNGRLDDESQHELLTIIDEESDRLNKLVSEAVEVAQLDTQQVHLTFGKISLATLVEQARKACFWIENDHPLHVDVAPDLMVKGDLDFLQKALCNLLENAAKYS